MANWANGMDPAYGAGLPICSAPGRGREESANLQAKSFVWTFLAATRLESILIDRTPNCTASNAISVCKSFVWAYLPVSHLDHRM
jgi:hypothetical protein